MKYDKEAMQDNVRAIPIERRTNIRSLAVNLGVSPSTVQRAIKKTLSGFTIRVTESADAWK